MTPDNAGPLLLYVEDEPLILDLAVAALEDAGFGVAAFQSAAAAMSALDGRGADFEALITDIDLHSRVTGWDIAKHARELLPDLPIIYVSGGSASDWASMGVPGSAMIVKPYALTQLVVAVSSALVCRDQRPGGSH